MPGSRANTRRREAHGLLTPRTRRGRTTQSESLLPGAAGWPAACGCNPHASGCLIRGVPAPALWPVPARRAETSARVCRSLLAGASMSSEAELSQKGLSRSTYSATSLIQNQQAYSRDGRVRTPSTPAGHCHRSLGHSARVEHPQLDPRRLRVAGAVPGFASRKDVLLVPSDREALPTHPSGPPSFPT